jgi:hypothetical protein
VTGVAPRNPGRGVRRDHRVAAAAAWWWGRADAGAGGGEVGHSPAGRSRPRQGPGGASGGRAARWRCPGGGRVNAPGAPRTRKTPPQTPQDARASFRRPGTARDKISIHDNRIAAFCGLAAAALYPASRESRAWLSGNGPQGVVVSARCTADSGAWLLQLKTIEDRIEHGAWIRPATNAMGLRDQALRRSGAHADAPCRASGMRALTTSTVNALGLFDASASEATLTGRRSGWRRCPGGHRPVGRRPGGSAPRSPAIAWGSR